jgi:hypothetical protein
MEDWDDERIAEVYNKYAPAGELMNMDHFSTFLISAKNSIFKKEQLELCQDMNQPLAKYFVNSSHNT